MNARGLAQVVGVEGRGLHSGAHTQVTLRPAPWGTGRVFVCDGVHLHATLANAVAEPGATLLRCDGAQVRTVEHLLATLDALGVTDVFVEVDGDELPAGDGSALVWVSAVDRAGRVDGPPLPQPPPVSPNVASAHGGSAHVFPGDEVSVEVSFAGGPEGRLRVARSEARFRAEVAWARTFVLASDVPALLAAGRGRGATTENTVVWPGSALRSPDECVRHKLLDAWGDLALRGPGPAGFHVVRGSHQLHLLALRPPAQSNRT